MDQEAVDQEEEAPAAARLSNWGVHSNFRWKSTEPVVSQERRVLFVQECAVRVFSYLQILQTKALYGLLMMNLYQATEVSSSLSGREPW